MGETTSTYRAPSSGGMVQNTTNFWTLVILIASMLVSITVVIVTRPDEQKVQQMIDLNLGRVGANLERVEEKVDYTGVRLDRIESKIDQLNEHGDNR